MLTDASTSALTGAVVWQIAQEEVQVMEEQAMASCGRSSLPGKPSSRPRLTTIWTEAWPGRPRLCATIRNSSPITMVNNRQGSVMKPRVCGWVFPA